MNDLLARIKNLPPWAWVVGAVGVGGIVYVTHRKKSDQTSTTADNTTTDTSGTSDTTAFDASGYQSESYPYYTGSGGLGGAYPSDPTMPYVPPTGTGTLTDPSPQPTAPVIVNVSPATIPTGGGAPLPNHTPSKSPKSNPPAGYPNYNPANGKWFKDCGHDVCHKGKLFRDHGHCYQDGSRVRMSLEDLHRKC